jgi:hypothetical protein
MLAAFEVRSILSGWSNLKSFSTLRRKRDEIEAEITSGSAARSAPYCRQALEHEGPLDTRELAIRVMRSKGLDEADRLMRVSVAYRITQALHCEGNVAE